MQKPDPKLAKKLFTVSALKDPSQVVLLKHIDNVEERFDGAISDLNEKVDDGLEQAKEMIRELSDPLRGVDMVKIKGQKGEKGDKGDNGKDGVDGKIIKGIDGNDGTDGKNGRDGVDGKDGKDGQDGRDGKDGKNGIDGKDGEKGDDATVPKELLDNLKRIPDIERMAQVNSLPVTTSFFNGLRAKNLNITGGTTTQSGDTVTVAITASGGGTLSIQQPTSGAVGQDTFGWATAPTIIFRDGVAMQKQSADGTVNWTGTTTTVLATWPNFDIFGI